MGCPLLRNAFAGLILILLSNGKFSSATLLPTLVLMLRLRLRLHARTVMLAFHLLVVVVVVGSKKHNAGGGEY